MFEFICLANSKKLLARCVACIRVDDGTWIRPISSAAHGEISVAQMNLDQVGDPLPFDILRVNCSKHVGSNSQPENWMVEEKQWELVRRPAQASASKLLTAALNTGENLLGSSTDRVPEQNFALSPAPASLALVKPQNLRWLTDSYEGRKKARANFTFGATNYNLGVTDPPFEEKLKALQEGFHTSAEIGIEDESRLLLTVSLAEPFNGNCYKLVAGVLVLPEDWPTI